MFISTTLNKDTYTVFILDESTGNSVECFSKLQNPDDYKRKLDVRIEAIDRFIQGDYNKSINLDN